MRTLITTLCATLLIVLCGTASAVPITGLYNTGLDSGGSYLATGANDGNYTVIASPNGPFIPVAVDDTAYPIPPWIANNTPNSRWIGVPGNESRGPGGNYVYRTTFNLPANADLSTAMLGGMWATDNVGLNIRINGNPTGQNSFAFTALTPFSVTSGFNVGLNTLDFVVNNASGPTGLRVDRMRGKYDLVPEPGTCLLAVIGLGGMLVRRRT